MSKTVAVAEFQEHSLELFEEVAEKQVEVVVVKDGKPLARVVPVPLRHRTLEEMRAEGVKPLGDLIEPVGEWDIAK